MSELPRLIVDAESKVLGVKTTLDNWITYIQSIRADIAKCETELAEKVRAGDAQIAHLRSEIHRL
jgi:hypothetical protein